MNSEQLTSILNNPESTHDELRAALRFAIDILHDYAVCLKRQEVTGDPHYMIRMEGSNHRPQLTVTGPDEDVEERLCELLGAYLYLWGMRSNGSDATQKAAIKEATGIGMRTAMLGMKQAMDEVCPGQWRPVTERLQQLAGERTDSGTR